MRITLVVLIGAVILARLCLFSVDRTEFVYLTQFGRYITTYDGANDDQAGLHFKWPWPMQAVQRLDRRLQAFELPGAELLTRDPKGNTIDKTLTLDAYVCWRIAETPASVDRFVRTVGTSDGARALLGQRITSELGAAIGQMELDDLISTEPGRVDRERERLRQRLLNGVPQGQVESPFSLRRVAVEEYGIDVVDIRLRRANHPSSVRDAIFLRINSERDKKVAEYQSEGERRAADIKSASDRRVADLRTEAEAEALRIRGTASAKADRIRSEAGRLDPRFYAFLKNLEDYQRFLGDNKTMLLLSTHRELFDTLFQPPTPEIRNPKSEIRKENSKG
jgi:modulator of FtsH protease HflC